MSFNLFSAFSLFGTNDRFGAAQDCITFINFFVSYLRIHVGV